jgi:hypothetical protein
MGSAFPGRCKRGVATRNVRVETSLSHDLIKGALIALRAEPVVNVHVLS